MKARLQLCVIALTSLAPGAFLRAQEPAAAPPKPASSIEDKGGKLTWENSMAAGRKRALAEKRPMLIVAGAPWCPYCTRLKSEMEQPQVKDELRRFVLVDLDVDEQPVEARQLSVSGIPALRLVDVRGQVAASRDGFLPADQLVAWLKQGKDAATPTLPEVLTATGKPGESAVPQLLAELSQADAVRREAATRRLLAFPDATAKVVAAAFREGKLATKLAALELLREWQAPVEGLDPWRPETLTGPRLAALDAWATAAKHAPPATRALNDQERAALQRELSRLMAADDAEVETLRERLSRWRGAILPLATTAWQEATDDRARERLQALRYRLLISDLTALAWPGGIDRLASSEGKTRHDAVGELSEQAASADEPLLLELFKDPDPLVRELALAGLQKVAGAGSHSALAGLLDDPEPNVRAAVLKQLAENPVHGLIPAIVAYVDREKDPDLLIHAIRFLKAAKGEEAFERLITLFKHESWQVRAEAAEAVGEIAGARTGQDRRRADAYVAIIGLLDDEDPFVVSRALGGMRHADLDAAVEPLAKIIEKHPELATRAIEVLVSGGSMRQKALPHLRNYVAHANPVVRAAAITALAEVDLDVADEPVILGLNDADSTVRQAATKALNKMFAAAADAHSAADEATPVAREVHEVVVQPGGGIISRTLRVLAQAARAAAPADVPEGAPAPDVEAPPPPAPAEVPTTPPPQPAVPPPPAEVSRPAGELAPPGALAPSIQASPQQAMLSDDEAIARYETWLADYRAGKGRPEWMARAIAPLEKMLSAEDRQERLLAALALVPLGRDEVAMPVLEELANTSPDAQGDVAAVVRFLPREKRHAFFAFLLTLNPSAEHLAEIARGVAMTRSVGDAELLWGLLGREKADLSILSAVYASLQQVYAAQPGDRPGEDKLPEELLKRLRDFAAKGTPWQRVAALCLLLGPAPDDAADAAAAMLANPNLAFEFRRDALQVLLLAQSPKEGEATAVRYLTGEQKALRKLAAVYLTLGPDAMSQLRGNGIYLQHTSPVIFSGSGEAQAVTAPRGLTVDVLKPLLDDPEPDVAASAAYLLATLGDDGGFDKLVHRWRNEGGEAWRAPVYRAIAALDDDARTPILQEINAQLDRYEKRDFYWTIRSMHGPEVLKLRKMIRDEVGMQQLR